ncbi:hypothetical protein DOJK_01737 [Patescibacteria group bacterium]|nr:hypothetical protein DOJK_01737 [Patescibacteria group bacterium]
MPRIICGINPTVVQIAAIVPIIDQSIILSSEVFTQAYPILLDIKHYHDMMKNVITPNLFTAPRRGNKEVKIFLQTNPEMIIILPDFKKISFLI